MKRSTLMQMQVRTIIPDVAVRSESERSTNVSIQPHRVLAVTPATTPVLSHLTSVPALAAINSPVHECLMLLTISADRVAELRQLIMRTCGELIVFIRTQPVAHASKMKVWLCLSNPLSSHTGDLVMHAVMQALPSAEFGKITYA